MIRSGKRRDTNQVVFRVPAVLAKPDITQYLQKLYSVAVTNIHTVNFPSHQVKARKRYVPAFKSAIVTYKGPSFAFPVPPDPKLLKFPRPDVGPVKFPKVK